MMAFQLIIHTKIWVIVMLGHSLHLIKTFLNNWASLVVQRLKRLPAMWETWVLSLGWEDPLEKEMAIHSSILAWRIPWTEELGGLQSTGRKESDTTERLNKDLLYGAGNSTQYSVVTYFGQFFHSPLSLSSRGSLVLLRFLP